MVRFRFASLVLVNIVLSPDAVAFWSFVNMISKPAGHQGIGTKFGHHNSHKSQHNGQVGSVPGQQILVAPLTWIPAQGLAQGGSSSWAGTQSGMEVFNFVVVPVPVSSVFGQPQGQQQGQPQGPLQGPLQGSIQGPLQGLIQGSFQGSLQGPLQGQPQGQGQFQGLFQGQGHPLVNRFHNKQKQPSEAGSTGAGFVSPAWSAGVSETGVSGGNAGNAAMGLYGLFIPSSGTSGNAGITGNLIGTTGNAGNTAGSSSVGPGNQTGTEAGPGRPGGIYQHGISPGKPSGFAPFKKPHHFKDSNHRTAQPPPLFRRDDYLASDEPCQWEPSFSGHGHHQREEPTFRFPFGPFF